MTPHPSAGPYRTLAVKARARPWWLRLAAWLVEIPALYQASEWRWYRRAIGGHWERVAFLPFGPGPFMQWERTDGRCSLVHGKLHSPSYDLYDCEDYPPPPRPTARGV